MKLKKNLVCASNFALAGDQPAAVKKLVRGINKGVQCQTLLGVTGSGKTFAVAKVIEQVQKPTLVLAPNKTLAAQLYGEMKTFFPSNAIEYFVSYYDYYQPEAYVPASDVYIEKDASINEHIERMRLSATKALLERQDVIIVATVSAIYGLGDPVSYLSMVLHLDRGDIIDQRQLLKKLANMQYTRNDTEFQRATFRVRGDIIDIFPAESEQEGVRIELFGDEIESLSLIDPLTGKLLRKVQRATVYPKTHYVTPKERLLETIKQIKVELTERIGEFKQQRKLVEAQRIEQRTLFDIEMMLELGYCSGIENYSRYLSGREAGEPPPTLIDYLPAEALLIIDESHVTIPQLQAMYRGDRARKENLVGYGFRLPSALDNRPLKFEEFVQLQPQTIFVSATPSEYELTHSKNVVEQIVRPTGLLDPQIVVKPVATQVDDVLSEISHCVKLQQRVLITTLTKKMAEDLTDYLADHGVRVRYLHSDIDTVERVEIIRDLRLGTFDVLVGINLLREGLDMPEVALVAILDADKEGFLRSERSLIQTIGRAARNIDGRVILYADKCTKSMSRAISETERRRTIQQDYNTQHGITPKTIRKAITDIMDSGDNSKYNYRKLSKSGKYGDIMGGNSLDLSDINQMNHKEAAKLVACLEKRMYMHAKDLEFEKAALLRDQLKVVREIMIDL